MGSKQLNQNRTSWRLLKTGVVRRWRPHFDFYQNLSAFPVRSIVLLLTALVGSAYIREKTFSQMKIILTR